MDKHETQASLDAMADILMDEAQKSFDKMAKEDERNDRNQ